MCMWAPIVLMDRYIFLSEGSLLFCSPFRYFSHMSATAKQVPEFFFNVIIITRVYFIYPIKICTIFMKRSTGEKLIHVWSWYAWYFYVHVIFNMRKVKIGQIAKPRGAHHWECPFACKVASTWIIFLPECIGNFGTQIGDLGLPLWSCLKSRLLFGTKVIQVVPFLAKTYVCSVKIS